MRLATNIPMRRHNVSPCWRKTWHDDDDLSQGPIILAQVVLPPWEDLDLKGRDQSQKYLTTFAEVCHFSFDKKTKDHQLAGFIYSLLVKETIKKRGSGWCLGAIIHRNGINFVQGRKDKSRKELVAYHYHDIDSESHSHHTSPSARRHRTTSLKWKATSDQALDSHSFAFLLQSHLYLHQLMTENSLSQGFRIVERATKLEKVCKHKEFSPCLRAAFL